MIRQETDTDRMRDRVHTAGIEKRTICIQAEEEEDIYEYRLPGNKPEDADERADPADMQGQSFRPIEAFSNIGTVENNHLHDGECQSGCQNRFSIFLDLPMLRKNQSEHDEEDAKVNSMLCIERLDEVRIGEELSGHTQVLSGDLPLSFYNTCFGQWRLGSQLS